MTTAAQSDVRPADRRAAVQLRTAWPLVVEKETHTPRRTIRIEDRVWDAAQTKAASRDETVSDVIRRALERYVKSK